MSKPVITGLMRLVLGVAVVGVLAIVPSATAHPFHLSLAEVQYEQEADALEVALRVFPDDLELALRQRTGERIVLESTPGIDSIIESYVRAVFFVEPGDDHEVRFEWVGMELGVKEVWIYFVWRGLGDLSEAALTNSVLLDVRPSQTNTVVLSIGSEKRTYTFTIDQPKQRLVDVGREQPIMLEVERRYAALELIVQNAPHLNRAERTAFELLAACASELLLHPSEPDQEAEDQRLLDAALELVGQGPGGEVSTADRLRLGVMSASAGHVRSSFNLLAEAVASSGSKNDASSAPPEALRGAAKLARRHADDKLAQSFLAAADGSTEDMLLALGEARAYVRGHDHDGGNHE